MNTISRRQLFKQLGLITAGFILRASSIDEALALAKPKRRYWTGWEPDGEWHLYGSGYDGETETVYLDGKVSEIRVYDYAMTWEEACQLYALTPQS